MTSCRFCNTTLTDTFVDLGMSPLCQTQIHETELSRAELFYPLRVFICNRCFLVQLDEYVAPDVIFSKDYPYFSSYSDSWTEHARAYTEKMIREFSLNKSSFVVEIASNDGYLLRHFVDRRIRCLGIEPTAGTAQVAIENGIESIIDFFDTALAKQITETHGQADLVLGNNVLAHVPELNDFVNGVRILLARDGYCTFEFPHLEKLIQHNQFDTIYHEHFSYFSFSTVNRIFQHHHLPIFDVEQLNTHGGSLRVYAQHSASGVHGRAARVDELLENEKRAGIFDLSMYNGFEEKVHKTKRELLRFLIDTKENGKSIVGYGAPGKGNTLLNYCGIGTDFLDYTVDRNPAKQGTYTPGTRIPIVDPKTIMQTKPDFILILPWNLKEEIVSQIPDARKWGCRFVVPIPEIDVF